MVLLRSLTCETAYLVKNIVQKYVVLPEYINLVSIPKNEFYFWSALYEIGFLDWGIEDIR